MSRYSRDDVRYWSVHRPRDHNDAGLFMYGPQEALPVTARIAQPNHCSDETPLIPERQRVRLQRARAFVRAVMGTSTRPFVRG